MVARASYWHMGMDERNIAKHGDVYSHRQRKKTMSRKATIYKLPEKYVVVKDGKVIGFGRSRYNSAEIAKEHGAKKVEDGECSELLKPPIL